MSFTIKMFKETFLQTGLTSHVSVSVITFIIVPIISGTICGTTNILVRTGLTYQKIYQEFGITVKVMVNLI